MRELVMVRVDASTLSFAVTQCDCAFAKRASASLTIPYSRWEHVFLALDNKYGDVYRQLCCYHCNKVLSEARA